MPTDSGSITDELGLGPTSFEAGGRFFFFFLRARTGSGLLTVRAVMSERSVRSCCSVSSSFGAAGVAGEEDWHNNEGLWTLGVVLVRRSDKLLLVSEKRKLMS